MAITEYQRGICRLIARNRIEQGEAYVAGGVALNTLIQAPRLSRDIDLFHDTRAALTATWDADRRLLEDHSYTVDAQRERPTFVEALVRRGGDTVAMQWVCDSAYRFFPLVEHDDFGLTMHPFDLATNKVLALVGRLEVRDWIDVMACSDRLQHLGYLAWAACGKDPGYNPAMILAEARRASRYSAVELAQLSFAGEPPDAGVLSRKWAETLNEANEIIEALPSGSAGRCVATTNGDLFQGLVGDVQSALRRGELIFHEGSLRGALPSILDPARTTPSS